MAGSLGYAGRLKNKKNLGGQLGATEFMEEVQVVKDKVTQLSDMILDAQRAKKQVFFFTGAGISTSIGIPDFRGPNGIWTLKKKKLPVTAPVTPFEHAKPSFTHMVIAAMVAGGQVNMVCSQNVDSLHLRSGVPRDKLAELHGNCFAERCSTCGHERVRDFQVETVGFKATGRSCSRAGCGGVMKDNVLDWDSMLPDDELDASIAAAETAGVCLVLGSSLQIAPANEIPLFTSDNGGKLVIINLQKTPRDRSAAMLLRARVDAAMALTALKLGLDVPPYVRLDGVVACHARLTPGDTFSSDPVALTANPQQHRDDVSGEGTAAAAGSCPMDSGQAGPGVLLAPQQPSGADTSRQLTALEQQSPGLDGRKDTWGFRLAVQSVHGQGCMLPMVEAVSVQLEGDGGAEGGPVGRVSELRVGCFQPPAGRSNGPAPVQESLPNQQQDGMQVDDGPDSGEPGAAAAGEEGRAGGLQGNGHVTIQTPSSSGGVPLGGPYEFGVTGIPQGVTQVRCHVTLHLAQWADPDKRKVTLLPYVVTRDGVTSHYPSDEEVASLVDGTGLTLPGQAPPLVLQQLGLARTAASGAVGTAQQVQDESKPDTQQKPDDIKMWKTNGETSYVKKEIGQHQGSEQQQAGNGSIGDNDQGVKLESSSAERPQAGSAHEVRNGAADALAPPTQAALGPHASVAARTDQATLFTYVSQVVRFDAASVWAAYEANPPPVVQPPAPQPRKKQRTGPKLTPAQAADLAAAEAGVELRRSARRGGAAPAPAPMAAADAGVGSWEQGSEDLEED